MERTGPSLADTRILHNGTTIRENHVDGDHVFHTHLTIPQTWSTLGGQSWEMYPPFCEAYGTIMRYGRGWGSQKHRRCICDLPGREYKMARCQQYRWARMSHESTPSLLLHILSVAWITIPDFMLISCMVRSRYFHKFECCRLSSARNKTSVYRVGV